jgi:signal peptidase
MPLAWAAGHAPQLLHPVELAPVPAAAPPAFEPEPISYQAAASYQTEVAAPRQLPIPAVAPVLKARAEPLFTAEPVTPVYAAERPRVVVAPSKAPARHASHRFGPREIATVPISTMLVGLAILLTPVTQVFGGMQLLAVMSGSMEPTIQVGGIVAVRPVPISALQVGNVITFANQSNPDVLITHRIVSLEARDGQTLPTTKGDANDSVDAVTVAGSRAVGRVDFTLPWLGYLMMLLASPVAKVAILAISVIGFALPATKRKPEPATDPPAPAAQAAPPSAPVPSSSPQLPHPHSPQPQPPPCRARTPRTRHSSAKSKPSFPAPPDPLRPPLRAS